MGSSEYSFFLGHSKIQEDIVLKFLADGMKFNSSYSNERPLLFCCKRGFTKCVEILLSKKETNPSVYNNESVFLSCKHGNFDILKLLLKDSRIKFYNGWFDRCLDIDQIGYFDLSHFKMIKKILFRYKSKIELTRKKPSEIVKSILKNPKSINFDKIISVIENYDVTTLSTDADIFHLATSVCEEGDLSTMKFLLEVVNLDPSLENNFLLYLACQRGHVDILKYLMKDDRVDPTASENILYAYSFKVIKTLMKDERNNRDFRKWKIILEDGVREGKVKVVNEILSDPRYKGKFQNDFYLNLIKTAYRFGYPNKYRMIFLLVNHKNAKLKKVDDMLIKMYEKTFQKPLRVVQKPAVKRALLYNDKNLKKRLKRKKLVKIKKKRKRKKRKRKMNNNVVTTKT